MGPICRRPVPPTRRRSCQPEVPSRCSSWVSSSFRLTPPANSPVPSSLHCSEHYPTLPQGSLNDHVGIASRDHHVDLGQNCLPGFLTQCSRPYGCPGRRKSWQDPSVSHGQYLGSYHLSPCNLSPRNITLHSLADFAIFCNCRIPQKVAWACMTLLCPIRNHPLPDAGEDPAGGRVAHEHSRGGVGNHKR